MLFHARMPILGAILGGCAAVTPVPSTLVPGSTVPATSPTEQATGDTGDTGLACVPQPLAQYAGFGPSTWEQLVATGSCARSWRCGDVQVAALGTEGPTVLEYTEGQLTGVIAWDDTGEAPCFGVHYGAPASCQATDVHTSPGCVELAGFDEPGLHSDLAAWSRDLPEVTASCHAQGPCEVDGETLLATVTSDGPDPNLARLDVWRGEVLVAAGNATSWAGEPLWACSQQARPVIEGCGWAQ